ncbi:MAG: hypothetical protein JKY95_01220 [Planctomycetaceae bacterium]|nr:hypothetical protein [Planctomycetaceae bacterium]
MQNKLLMLPILFTLMVSLCGGCFGMAYISGLSTIRDNPIHKQSVELAQENETIALELGQPITGGLFTGNGTINIEDAGEHGYADNVVIPISGPKGKGTLTVKATLSEKVWTITQLTASLETSGKVITLVEIE